MKYMKSGAFLAITAMLSACGGGSGGGGTTASNPSPAPAPTASTCSLSSRQTWAFDQLDEFYLFPETLPASLNPAPFPTVQAYIDELTSTARAQGKDRFFTYLTSIEEENAFFAQGASAGFGIRLGYDTANNRVFVIEAFENAPALTAGMDRGTEILAIGTTPDNLREVSAILAAEGPAGVTNALGPPTAGTSRVLRIANTSGTSEVTVTKQEYELLAVSPRYGASVINDNGKRVGYINLRTFIDSAGPALRDAFLDFRQQGITEVIIDFRYNGGGLVSIAELMGDLMGRDRNASDVFSFTTFRPSLSSNNDTRTFAQIPQSIAPTKIAFIGRGGTASASELVINAFGPYLDANVGLIGTNTFGKPVGQIARDQAECDDRLRVVAFKTENADREGEYFNGLAETVDSTCQAPDDIFAQLGDPNEASVSVALDFLAGRSCTPIAGGFQAQSSRRAGEGRQILLTPNNPTVFQREVPGAF